MRASRSVMAAMVASAECRAGPRPRARCSTPRCCARRKRTCARRPVLARIIDVVGPAPLRVNKSPAFAALLESIVYQQITGKAAASIHRKLCAAIGRKIPRPQDITAASDEMLRGAGLSG